MCLYPQLLTNRKYLPNKKNKGQVPYCNDERLKLVAVGCGNCIECRKQKARNWKVRLNEEIRNNKGTFITFTFSNESLDKLKQSHEYIPENELNNYISTKAIRLFLENWRKKYKQSLKHWFITELGHTGTERIHIHGIIIYPKTLKPEIIEKYKIQDIEEYIKNDIIKRWTYGYSYHGYCCNEITINYIMKYLTKIDLLHKWFTPKILCSPGIGSNYLKRIDSQTNIYNNEKTNEMYKTYKGSNLPLPIYYRNKIYSEDEREKLWLQKLDTQTRYVLGKKINMNLPGADKTYEQYLKLARLKNKELGYGSSDWNSKAYKRKCKLLRKKTLEIKKLNKFNISNNSESPKESINKGKIIRDLGKF